jgi:hypothetical protein
MMYLPTLGTLLELPYSRKCRIQGKPFTDVMKSNESLRPASKIIPPSTGRNYWMRPISGVPKFWIGPSLFSSDAFREIDMVQMLTDLHGIEVLTTRCPVWLDRTVLKSQQLAPKVGQHTEAIQKEFGP